MRILIADDHELIRAGVKRILADAQEIQHVGEARDAEQVLSILERESYDILVLDINLAGRSGLELLKDLKHRYPKLPVLMLSMYPEAQFAVRVIKAGAIGYVNKASAATELVTAIRKIATSGKYINPTVAEQLAEAVDAGTEKEPHEFLSDREFEVFNLIGKGKTISEIAALLHRSVKTISTHRTHILTKMNLHNNAEIMQYVLERQPNHP